MINGCLQDHRDSVDILISGLYNIVVYFCHFVHVIKSTIYMIVFLVQRSSRTSYLINGFLSFPNNISRHRGWPHEGSQFTFARTADIFPNSLLRSTYTYVYTTLFEHNTRWISCRNYYANNITLKVSELCSDFVEIV